MVTGGRFAPSVFLVVALGLLVAAPACGGDAVADDDEGEAAINGGRVEYGYTSAGVVDTKLGSFCSGVLIAKNIVLTAAHCALSDFGVAKPDAFYLGLGKKLPGNTTEVPDDARLTRYEVAEAVVFGTVDEILTDACPHTTPDVALLRLQTSVPDVVPAVLGEEPEAGEVCTSVGYGHHYDAGGTSTKLLRRSARLTMVEVLPEALHLRRKTGISEGGDSGGPLFCGRKLVGLTSCGDAETYETDDYYARLTTVRAKIDRRIRLWNARPSP